MVVHPIPHPLYFFDIWVVIFLANGPGTFTSKKLGSFFNKSSALFLKSFPLAFVRGPGQYVLSSRQESNYRSFFPSLIRDDHSTTILFYQEVSGVFYPIALIAI